MNSENKPENVSPVEENPLIDMYMKKSLFSRISKAVTFLLLLLMFTTLAAWYGWQVLEPQQRETWRRQYPAVQQVDATLRQHGLLPEHDPLTDPAPPRNNPAKPATKATRQAQGPASNSKKPMPGQSEDEVPLIDMNRYEHLLKKPDTQPPSQSISAKKADKHAPKPSSLKVEPVRKLDDAGYTIVSSEEATITERHEKVARIMTEGGVPVRMKAWDIHYRLTWDDFTNENTLDEKRHAGAYIASSIHFSVSKHGFKAFAVMYPNRSWVRSGYANPYTLAHEQLHFDITEIYARKLRAQLSGLSPEEVRRARKLYAQVRTEWRAAQAAYDNATHHGRRRDMQAKYQADVTEALEALADYFWKPKWRRSSPFMISHFYRGQTYELGIEGMDQSWILARKAYSQSRNQGRGEAGNNLARMYQFGLGVEKDERKAFKMYRAAANRGSDVAKFNLGIMYWRGIGTEASEKKALDLFTETAEKLPYARHALLRMEHGDKQPTQSVRRD